MHPPFRLDFDATIIEHLFGEMQGNFGKKQEKLENFLFKLWLDSGLLFRGRSLFIADFGLELSTQTPFSLLEFIKKGWEPNQFIRASDKG